MSELEALISKHLDGELTPSELLELRRLLASSPDALAIYREMTSIRRAARRAPTLRQPSAASEARLFAQLGREGLRVDRQPRPLPSASTVAPMRSRLAAAASLMLVALIALGTLFSLRTDAPSPIAGTSADRSGTLPDRPRTPEVAHDRLAALETPTRTDAATTSRDNAASTGSETLVAGTRPSRSATASSSSTDRVRSRTTSKALAAAPEMSSTAATSPLANSADAPAPETTTTDARSPETITTDARSPEETSTVQRAPESTTLAASDGALSRAPIDSIESTDRALSEIPLLLPVPGEADDASTLGAAVRYGESVIEGSLSERADDFSLGLELALGDGQRLTLLAGRSAAVTEQRAYNTHSVPARAAFSEGKDEGASLQRVDETPANELAVGKEWWLGLGYNVDLFAQDRFAIGAGARGGIGGRSLRVGVEMPVRYSISDRLAVEAVMSGAYVVPHNAARNEFSVQSTSDGFVYEGETEHTAFGTYGVSIGLRVALD